jgi:hypothetical protein
LNNLKEWSVHHIKQKDAIKRDLVSFKEEGGNILCEYKEGHAIYYCWDNINLEKIKAVDGQEVAYFVCFCNEHNFKVLVDHWDLFKTRPNFTFIFLNPNLSEKWIIKPFIHAKIADPATLKQGLRTMYDTCMGKEAGVEKPKKPKKMFEESEGDVEEDEE